MSVKEIGLIWIVVKDIKAAIKYYTEVVGLKLMEVHEEFGWAELAGTGGGCRLGIAQENPQEKVKAGQNAVMTFNVSNIEETKRKMVQKGAKCDGDIMEVPGHVKMQTMIDQDGNSFQICEVIQHHHSCCHC
jgi:predicted enzyme related to lactoylglutathione lyase